VTRRTAIFVAVVAVLLVAPLAAAAAAHEEHKVDKYTVEVGFGTEPAYAGVINSVQLIITNNGKPVTDAKGLKVAVSTGDSQPKQMALEPYFSDEFGTPGDYRAFFIPTTPGAYTFKVTGTLGGRKVDQSYTSGKDGFDEVTDPAEVQYPVQQPSGSQLTSRLDRETTRLNAALAAQRAAADDEVAGARRLATIGLVVGALGLLAAVGVGVLALRRRS
jgi:opacity protein-like surface antigen